MAKIKPDVSYEETKYGFRFGPVTVERLFSDKKKGWVVLGLETRKADLQVYVTKTGKVRISSPGGKEWKEATDAQNS